MKGDPPLSYNPKDHYFKKAKKDNYVARSIYKLEEIDQKYKLFKKNDLVLDLGAAPGSWSQYAVQKVGTRGFVIGVDLQPIKVKFENALFLESDLRDVNFNEVLQKVNIQTDSDKVFDVILSDMAPKTTGIRTTDQARSAQLCELAMDISEKYLKKQGHLVMKLFHSDDFKDLKKRILTHFEHFQAVKPDSTRKESKEIFLVGLGNKD